MPSRKVFGRTSARVFAASILLSGSMMAAGDDGSWKERYKAIHDETQKLLAQQGETSSWQAAQLEIRLAAAEHLFTATNECMGPNKGYAWHAATGGAAGAQKLLDEADVILTSIRAGKDPYDGWNVGTFWRAYRSRLDDAAIPYSVQVPAGFDRGKKYRLHLELHSAGAPSVREDYLRPWSKYAPPGDTIVVAPTGRGRNGYKWAGERDIFEVIDDVKKRYPIDDTRIRMGGESMGGLGSYYLGANYPHLFSCLLPGSGLIYYKANTRYQGTADELNDHGESTPTAWMEDTGRIISPYLYHENLLNLPLFIWHPVLKQPDGKFVSHLPPAPVRDFVRRLRESGCRAEHSEEPFQNKEVEASRAAFAAEAVLNRFPRRVIFKTGNLMHSRAYWLQVLELASVKEFGRVEAGVGEANAVKLSLENVERVRLDFPEALFDRARPVALSIGGQTLTVDAGKTYAVIGRDGESWKLRDAEAVPAGLVKGPDLSGPIYDVFRDRFLCVIGGRDRDKNLADYRKELEVWQHPAITLAGGIVGSMFIYPRVKTDQEVTDQDIAESHVILLGTPENNTLLAKVISRTPVTLVSASEIRVGDKSFKGENLGITFIYPNPLNPRRYAVVNAGYTHQAGASDSLGLLPDYVVFKQAPSKAYNKFASNVVGFGTFDTHWNP